MSDSSN
jgi:hypothetical protein